MHSSFFQTSGPSRAKAQQAKKPQKPQAVLHDLNVSLEDMYNGCTKKIKITRRRNGKDDAKILEILVQKGWKEGTKLTYENEGDQDPVTGLCSDIIFVIKQKPHPTWTRSGNDLVCKVPISLGDALCGVKKDITHIDGNVLTVDTTSSVLSPDQNKKFFWGKGFTTSKGTGNCVVEFLIQYPTHLSAQQKELIKRAGI